MKTYIETTKIKIKHYKSSSKNIVISGGSCLKRSSTQVTWGLQRMGQNGCWTIRTSNLLVIQNGELFNQCFNIFSYVLA